MRKNALSFSAAMLLASSLILSPSAFAFPHAHAPAKTAPQAAQPMATNLEVNKTNAPDVAAVQEILKELLEASNKHDLEGVLRHYSPNFISGDSLDLIAIRGLILDTWKMFPDIHYDSQTLEIRVNGNWATVESLDSAKATAKLDTAVSDKAGVMKSRSRGMLYLHRTGKVWEILSDATLYEKAVIVYGPYDNVDIDVETPEQVFAGESYTAKVNVAVPAGNIAFATLSQEPLTYPQQTGKDKFRTLSTDNNDLERIFKANSTNNNEVVTATVGFTEIGQDTQERPTINLKGILTIIKRVNVTPKSNYTDPTKIDPLVHNTADGKIKLTPKSATPDTDDDSTNDAQPGMQPAPTSPED